jgi:hypothetical protein
MGGLGPPFLKEIGELMLPNAVTRAQKQHVILRDRTAGFGRAAAIGAARGGGAFERPVTLPRCVPAEGPPSRDVLCARCRAAGCIRPDCIRAGPRDLSWAT